MPDLNLASITAAGLAVADREGASKFTMKAVADELGVTPMALYHHVADKTALVALLVDGVFQEVPLPPPTGDWREDLWQMARWLRDLVQAHPAVSHLRRSHQVWTPAVLPMTEHWFNLWRQSGLDLDDAVTAGSTTSMALIGLVSEELLFGSMEHPTSEAMTWTPTARLAFSRTLDREADFELVVRGLIDGVHARLTALDTTAPAKRSPRATRRAATG